MADWERIRRGLRKVVRDRGATLEDIAEAMCVTPRTVQEWLGGKEPGAKSMARLHSWVVAELATPGSVYAKAHGCTCSSSKDEHGNNYGKGWGITHTQRRKDKLWLVKLDCPLHGKNSGWRKESRG